MAMGSKHFAASSSVLDSCLPVSWIEDDRPLKICTMNRCFFALLALASINTVLATCAKNVDYIDPATLKSTAKVCLGKLLFFFFKCFFYIRPHQKHPIPSFLG